MVPSPPDRRRPARATGRTELLSGVHPVREALCARRRPLHGLWIQAGRRRPALEELRDLAASRGVQVRELDAEGLARRADSDARSQGVALEVGPLPVVPLEAVLEGDPPRWVVAADGVEDPQNLGAIVRVAEAAGARGLVVPERRSAPLSPAVSRASAGALEHLPVARVVNLPRSLEKLKKGGCWVLGADAEEGIDLFEAPDRLLTGDLVLVLGAEGRGIRPGVRAVLDGRLRIPLRGQVSSLNVAAAGAVVLFEWLRRHQALQRARSPEVARPGTARATSREPGGPGGGGPGG